ncbi:MAG: type III-B CRISPR module-associated protein Cmr5 [Clostridiaceae bacterium]|nr:type III-B CRISPR module-associated protein Cmr5 [Clostridiaceae bacterium]
MSRDIHNSMAQFAFSKVSEICKKNKGDKGDKEFRSLARSLPSWIQINGLATAAVYLFSKKVNGNAYEKMYNILNEWFKNKDCRISLGDKDLVEEIVNLDSVTYRLCVNETMNLCQWIKRFAEGMIESGD